MDALNPITSVGLAASENSSSACTWRVHTSFVPNVQAESIFKNGYPIPTFNWTGYGSKCRPPSGRTTMQHTLRMKYHMASLHNACRCITINMQR